MKETDVDHGYSWIILACCGVTYLIIAGSVKSFGVLYTELLDYYEAGAGNTAWISSVCLLLFMGLGPFSNFLGERFTYRIVMATGSCIVLVGYTASSFVTSMEMLYLTYGVITGIGYGLMFAPCTTIISFYFAKRRSLANGLMVSFSGLGNLGFPYIYRLLIDSYGLHGALLIIGAILFHACAASLLLRQPSQLLRKRVKTEEEVALTPHVTTEKAFECVNEVAKRICRLDLFRNPRYTVLLLAIFFQVGSYSASVVVLPGQVRSLGLGNETIVLCVSLLGAAEIVARAFLGWFADLNIIKRPILFMMCTFVSGVIGFIMPYFSNKVALIVYALFVGTFSGSFWSLMGVLIVDCVGLESFSPAFGLVSVLCGFSICISMPSAGWLEDFTGNWSMSFRFAGIMSAVSLILLAFQPIIEKISCCGKPKVLNHIEENIEIELTADISNENAPLKSK